MPTTFSTRLDALAETLAKALAILAGIFLIATMLLACANMILRAVHEPLPGTVELVGFFGAMLTAFSLGLAQRRRSHIFVGLLTPKLPRPIRRGADALQFLVSCAFFALAGIETARWGMDLIRSGELSSTLRLAYHPFVFAASLGCMAMAFVLFVDFLNTLPGHARTEEH
ncbi:TRAP-type C4-dicarboxylate transport system, small permease component [Paucidesulfovibrio gracilis DSM 16080]|uniref:TRAP-type C4-dicarboxylate transport system, small permease component n=1 Tax=Paucidesulfovibrio gracilis DSM 16080 TaxID=1121449 RepID=A0A1T4X2H8_9BACT|nr:TRAP transporter small permease [Paucidesulfovibrio gracilis]SKA83790.1 TRAP-type C4-dicarboxylate transport system, small permease component [Paucidesulfovibrio gracilis DSM 16080]